MAATPPADRIAPPPSLRAVDLLPKSTQDLRLDEILRTPGGALHPDEVIDVHHPNPNAVEIQDLGAAEEIGVAGRARRRAEDVEVAGIGLEGERVPRPERASIKLERDMGRSAAQARTELGERCRKALEILEFARIADI